MQLISYQKATEILDISMDTLKQAVSKRKVLTRAARRGRYVYLIEEQVRLFTGVNKRTGRKKRLSFEALTPEELKAWKQYEAEAASLHMADLMEQTPRSEDIRAMVQDEVDQKEEQLEEAFANFLMQMGLLFKNGIMPKVKNEAQKSEVPQGANFTRAS